MPSTSTIKDEALALGFDAVGVASVAPRSSSDQEPSSRLLPHLHERLRSWLARGYHATMTWMGRDPDRRSDPRRVLDGCRSVIMVGMNYDTGHRAEERHGMGRVARYAWGRDYHLVLGERLAALSERLNILAPGHRHRWYVDTGPVMEKAWAEQAGLGWIGKHSNLVSPQHGSWLVLGTILTTLDLDPDIPGTDLCGSCSICIKACPTGAIVEPYVVDAGRCISYLTIEHRTDDIPDTLAHRTGNHIFGCDDCLDVCPYNTQASATSRPVFAPFAWALQPSLDQLLTWTESEFRSRTIDSPVRRAKHQGWQRNLRMAQANESARSASAAELTDPR